MTTNRTDMRARLTALATTAALLTATTGATALPKQPGPGNAGAASAVPEARPAGKRLVIPASLTHRTTRGATAKDIRLKDGTRATAQHLAERFDPAMVVHLPNGKTITAQQLIDRLGQVEGRTKADGASLAHLKKTAWLRPSTPTKLSATDSKHPQLLAKAAQPVKVPSAMSPCSVVACEPTLKEKTIHWGDTWGDEDTVAAYTSLTVSSSHPSSTSAACHFDWDNGVYLLGSKKEVVRFVADGSGDTAGAPKTHGKATLYVLGQSKWTKEGSVSAEQLSRTFKTGAALSYPLIPGLSVKGSIDATATLSLVPTFDATAGPLDVGCKLDLVPRLETKVTGSAALKIGIDDLVDIAEGGVKGDVMPLDVSFPTSVAIGAHEAPPKLNVKLKSSIDATMMKGRIYAYYKIHDVCAWGVCLVEDILGIDTYGEYDLWKSGGYRYATSIVDLGQDVPFTPKGQSMSMAQ